MTLVRAVRIAALVTALAVLIVAIWFGLILREVAQAKVTVTNMARLHSFLEVFQPAVVDRQSLLELAVQKGTRVYLVDGWGEELRVSIVGEQEGKRLYEVRSFGRDRTEGPCCRGLVGDEWDEDAVIRGGKWLQIWR